MRTSLSSGTPLELVEGTSDRGLVIIPDIWGLKPLFVDLCESLRERTGWTVACLEPFPGRELPGAGDPNGLAARGESLRTIDDSDLLRDAVEAADATEAEAVGIIGFCMGGMYALKATSTGRFDRAVSFYGMAHVQEPWQGPGQQDPIELLAQRGDTAVMQIAGTEDVYLPPEHLVELEEAGVVVHRYEGAEHGFVHDPSRPVHRSDYAEDAWRKALDFLSGSSVAGG